jgi:hypothetical protein
MQMLHNQSDKDLENQISQLFSSISFKKNKNRRLLKKWAFLTTDQRENGTVKIYKKIIDMAPNHMDMARKRFELLQQLKELDQVLTNQGEDVAEILLRQYSGAVSGIVMYFAIFMLLFILGVIIWMNQIMYS